VPAKAKGGSQKGARKKKEDAMGLGRKKMGGRSGKRLSTAPKSEDGVGSLHGPWPEIDESTFVPGRML